MVFGLGLWTLLEKWELVLMVPGQVYEVTVWLLIGTGAVSVLISLLGYTAVAFESRQLVAWYTILLVTVFISSSVIGLLSYVYQDRLLDDLQAALTHNFISDYGLDQDKTLATDNIQIKVRQKVSKINLHTFNPPFINNRKNVNVAKIDHFL